MSMYKKICITNRKLVEGDFFTQLERVLKEAKPDMVILREKDLLIEDYKEMAAEFIELCHHYNTKCILHNFIDAVLELKDDGYKADGIHLPLPVLKATTASPLWKEELVRIQAEFPELGVSTHSVEEALAAQSLGATYITAGHVFATDCKQGVPPRGTALLTEISHAVHIPVYALGGIDETNAIQCIEAGASGVCMMSGYMNY